MKYKEKMMTISEEDFQPAVISEMASMEGRMEKNHRNRKRRLDCGYEVESCFG